MKPNSQTKRFKVANADAANRHKSNGELYEVAMSHERLQHLLQVFEDTLSADAIALVGAVQISAEVLRLLRAAADGRAPLDADDLERKVLALEAVRTRLDAAGAGAALQHLLGSTVATTRDALGALRA